MKISMASFAFCLALGWVAPVHAEAGNKEPAGGGATGSFTDERDGQTYKWVQIGSQKWMSQNLNFSIEKSLCYLKDTANCTILGRLYSHSDAKEVCPKGWKLPNEKDWNQLFKIAKDDYNSLKSKEGWDSARGLLSTKDGNGTDSYGFDVLPSGNQQVGEFSKPNQAASLWMVDKGNFVYGCHVDFLSSGGWQAGYGISNCTGIQMRASVRCIENVPK